MLTEAKIMEMLSKSEITVYEYIQKKSQENKGSMKESMKDIGNQLDLSEATVHRAIRKLRKQGIIGIIPSMEKAESNEIVYYGIPDPDKQATDIFKMIGELSSASNRFEAILKAKELENEQLMRDKELLYQTIDQLKMELQQSRTDTNVFNNSTIISSQSLDDGTTAYIVKNN
jgi:DNA-binding Lrp family transcriptional regulator